jgi:hypothetical protein
MLIASYGNDTVRLAVIVGGARIEVVVSRESWGRLVRGDGR